MADFAEVVKDIETTLKIFSYDRINYLMLMMKDRHVHFHIIPRYASYRDFAGLRWTDEGWPLMPPLEKPLPERAVLNKIINKLRKSISLS